MSNLYHYRVDAVRPDQGAGTVDFYRSPSKAAALEAFKLQYPSMADWTIEVTKISKEDMPVDPTLDVLVLPAITEFDPSVDPEAITDEQDIAYNAHCTRLIQSALKRMRDDEGIANPHLKTQYPSDTIEEGNDSRDVVTLDHHDDSVIVIDSGVR